MLEVGLFFFADFDHSGLRRRYYPWDLDAVFRSTTSGIYGRISKRTVSQTPYQRILLNHPALRTRYNAIMSALIAPDGPLCEAALHAFLDAVEPILSPALASDPFASEPPSAAFDALRNWISTRIPNVNAQVAADGPPASR